MNIIMNTLVCNVNRFTVYCTLLFFLYFPYITANKPKVSPIGLLPHRNKVDNNDNLILYTTAKL